MARRVPSECGARSDAALGIPDGLCDLELSFDADSSGKRCPGDSEDARQLQRSFVEIWGNEPLGPRGFHLDKPGPSNSGCVC